MSTEPKPEASTSKNPRIARSVVLGGATLTTALLAGVYYAYACSVMPGLGSTDDRTFIDAMQQINEAIQNPVFFLSFIGAPALTIAALIMERRSGARHVTRWLVAAVALNLISLTITGALNVPLNDDLSQAGDPSGIADLPSVRDDFENPWVAWNIVRTVVTTAALGCLGYALLLHGRAMQLAESGLARRGIQKAVARETSTVKARP